MRELPLRTWLLPGRGRPTVDVALNPSTTILQLELSATALMWEVSCWSVHVSSREWKAPEANHDIAATTVPAIA